MAEYVCGECGAQIGLADHHCLGCGSAHPYAVAEKPFDEPEARLNRGSVGFWALGGVFFLALSLIAFTAQMG